MKKSEADKENRSNERVRILSLVRYTVLPGMTSWIANIQNISLGGLAFLTEHEIEPETALKLCFMAPHKKISVEVQGAVVRCPKVVKSPALFQVGVRFTEVSEEAKAAILEIEAILSEQRKTAKA